MCLSFLQFKVVKTSVNMTTNNVSTWFHFVCILATTILLCYCTRKYIENESNSLIDFQLYHDTEKDIYPTLSLCFGNEGIYDNEKLDKTYQINNATKYITFLEGKLWDDHMLNVDYDAVTMSLQDYVEEVSIRVNTYHSSPVYKWINNDLQHMPTANDKQDERLFPFYTSFRQASMKCFSFDLNQEFIPEIKGEIVRVIFVRMKSVSARGVSLSYFMHYPNQLLRSPPLDLEYIPNMGIKSGNVAA